MAGVTKADIPEIAGFMSEFWLLVKKYWIPENNDRYWEGFHAESSGLYKKYPHEFSKRQILAFIQYLEECGREGAAGWRESRVK